MNELPCNLSYEIGEQWKPVLGFEEYYLVSNFGRVWSIRSECCIKLKKNQGYLRATLSVNGLRKDYAVHRLVALAFIPNPENKPTVNHLNENKQDNRVFNLAWATMHEQNVYGTRIERVKASTDWKGRKIDYSTVAAKHNYFSISKVQMKPVLQLDMNGSLISRYDGINVAARAVGVSAGGICSCLKGNRKSCGGYKWKYA